MVQHNSHEPSHTDDAPLFYAPCPRCEQTMTLCRRFCWRCQQEMRRDLERANEAAYDLHYGMLEEPELPQKRHQDEPLNPRESEFMKILHAERRVYLGVLIAGAFLLFGLSFLAAGIGGQIRHLDNIVRQIETRSEAGRVPEALKPSPLQAREKEAR